MPTTVLSNNIIKQPLKRDVEIAVLKALGNRKGNYVVYIYQDQKKAGVRIDIEESEGRWGRTFDSVGEFEPGYIHKAVEGAVFINK
jgi:hypothetical protein